MGDAGGVAASQCDTSEAVLGRSWRVVTESRARPECRCCGAGACASRPSAFTKPDAHGGPVDPAVETCRDRGKTPPGGWASRRSAWKHREPPEGPKAGPYSVDKTRRTMRARSRLICGFPGGFESPSALPRCSPPLELNRPPVAAACRARGATRLDEPSSLGGVSV